MKNTYNQQYYQTNNYKDYLFKKDRYSKLAIELNDFFDKINILRDKESKLLDYGCAVGFFLDGISSIGYKNTNGYDISEWAITQVDKKHNIIDINKEHNFDAVFFLDVLEHMTDEDIKEVFKKIKSNIAVVRIPCRLENENDFFLEISRMDKTHINCKTKKEWIKLFTENGYKNFIKLNLNNIYDSSGVFCAVFFNDNFYEKYV